MQIIKNYIKGVFVGVGKIIPGVSGSMIAISLGVYEKIIYCFANIFKLSKKDFIFLLSVGLGVISSIIVCGKFILYFLNKYYFLTILFFIGLISGSLSPIIKNAKLKISLKYICLLVLPMVICLILDLLNFNSFKMEYNYVNIIFIGMIEALTSIIPGISGTAIMLIFGVYDELIYTISSFYYVDKLIFLLIGIFLGLVLVSKFILYIFNKYRIGSNYLILGFSIMSIFLLLRNLIGYNVSVFSLIFGLLLFIIGFLVSYKS